MGDGVRLHLSSGALKSASLDLECVTGTTGAWPPPTNGGQETIDAASTTTLSEGGVAVMPAGELWERYFSCF